MAVTPLEPNDPDRLGDYELTGRLGSGGMGVVYLGRGPGGQMAAVKLVRADLAHDNTFRERFRREVEALRRVSGPRVARLLGADTEATQPYLVVEYVDGPTLADAVATNGPIAGHRLRALAAALAEAIVIIHEAGVIHRDLKPSNVILAADQPKLVDFGIASATGAIPLTMVGTVIGSAGWMAPEQAAGAVSTPAVDVFSWASLVAYAGTGRPPFGVGSPETVTARILNGAPDLVGLPQDVRAFVEAAFIRDPADRPSARAVLSGLVGREEASTDELVEETTNLIENTWVMPAGGWPAPPPGTPPQPAAASGPPPGGPAGKRRWPIVLAVVGVLALLAGVAAALALSSGDGDPDDAAVAPLPAPTTTTEPPTTTTTEATTTTEPGEPIPMTLSMAVDISPDDPVQALGDAARGEPCTDDDGVIGPGVEITVATQDGDDAAPPQVLREGTLAIQVQDIFVCVYELDFDLRPSDSYQAFADDISFDCQFTRQEVKTFVIIDC